MTRRQRLFTLATAIALSVCGSLSSPALAADDNDGLWTIFSTTDAFRSDDGASRWHYWFDAQARYFDLGTGINQYLVRPGIGYKPGDNLSAWAGYARLRSRNRSGNVADENRYWQQLSWTAGRWNNGTFSMRARLEQRSLSTGDDLGLVVRLMTKYVRPFGADSSSYVTVSLEPFVDLRDTDWGGESGIGQNRLSIGVGWRISRSLVLEAGYMNQYIFADSGEDRVNHLGVLNFKLKL